MTNVFSELFHLIQQAQLSQPENNLLWVQDEQHLSQEQLRGIKPDKLQVITNRYDQYLRLSQRLPNSLFNDFDFSVSDLTSFNQAFYRVSKERAVVHHVINQIYSQLPVGGKFWMLGHKNEGIKTHIQKTTALFNSIVELKKGKGQLSIACFTKNTEGGVLLDDQAYTSLRQLSLPVDSGPASGKTTAFNFASKPGVYGWNKIDQGSQILMATIASVLQTQSIKSVLDLGCGYGFLSMQLLNTLSDSQYAGLSQLVATDNCAGAVISCSENLKQHSFAQVIASDSSKGIEGMFDLVICNPPFHLGFTTSDKIHGLFLEQTKRRLSVNGRAFYVVNQFLVIANTAQQHGLNTRMISKSKGFKVLELMHS